MASLIDSVKAAVKSASDSAKAAYERAKSPPDTIRCSNDECAAQVLVPPSTFDWRCPTCQTMCSNEDAKCKNAACGKDKPGELSYMVKCTACSTVTPVPATRAALAFKSAGHSAKVFVASTAESAKKTYQHLKGHAAEFHCTTCNALLKNPNPPPAEAEGEGDAAGAAGAGGAGGAGAPASSAVPSRIDKVECPVCHKVTPVPETNFGNSIATTASSIKKGSAKAWMAVSRKKYCTCPVCEVAVEVPADQLPAEPAPAPAVNNAAAGAAPAAAAAGPAPGTEISVNLECPKCNTKFPAKVTL